MYVKYGCGERVSVCVEVCLYPAVSAQVCVCYLTGCVKLMYFSACMCTCVGSAKECVGVCPYQGVSAQGCVLGAQMGVRMCVCTQV